MSINNKVSVILINYNGIDDTRECIRSILQSSLVPHVVVVDNASMNDEAEQLQKEFSGITVIKNSFNGGFSYGNNIGIKWSVDNEFDYILLLNNDTVIDKDMIKILLESTSSSVITAPSMFYYADPNRIWYGGGYINRITGNAKHKRMDKVINVNQIKPESCTFASGCCFLISVETVKQIGLLDERFFMYCEDTEYCIRAQSYGVLVKYIPQAKLWHKVGSSSGGVNSSFSSYYMTRNRLIYIEMYKDFFRKSAKPFTIITRQLRALTCNNKKVREAFMNGINDYKKGIHGKASIL